MKLKAPAHEEHDLDGLILLSRRKTALAAEEEDLVPADQWRPLSRYHIHIARRLITLCLPELLVIFEDVHKMPFVLAALCAVVDGVLPSIQSWTTASLLVEVQKALTTSATLNLARTVQLCTLRVGVSAFRPFLRDFDAAVDQQVNGEVRRHTTSRLMEARLRLDMAGLIDPGRKAILRGTEVFTADRPAKDRHGTRTYGNNARSLVFTCRRTLTSVVSLCTAAALLLNTLWTAWPDKTLFRVQVALVFLAAFPSLARMCCSLTYNDTFDSSDAHLYQRREGLADLSRFENRREVQIGYLQSWVLAKWTEANDAIHLWKAQRRLNDAHAAGNAFKRSLDGTSELLVESLFQIALSMRLFPSAITLVGGCLCFRYLLMLSAKGTAGMLQHIARANVRAIEELYTNGETLFQSIWFLACFVQVGRIQPVIQAVPRFDEKTGLHDIVKFKPMKGPNGVGMKIEAINLAYKYPRADEYALKDINFIIWPGECLAVCGWNGSGKTTLLNVLARLVDYEGLLLINDIDARHYEPKSLHAAISATFQDYAKMCGSVAENVGMGDFEKLGDPAAMDAAIKGADISEFISGLPKGLDTPLSLYPRDRDEPTKQAKEDSPRSLSGGQWQKLAMARGFLKVPVASLLIYDEPTASLDAIAEHRLFEQIFGLAKTPEGETVRTTIFCTHRFNTVKRASRIAIFEKGTIVELCVNHLRILPERISHSGTHKELMALGGQYKTFYETQKMSFADDPEAE